MTPARTNDVADVRNGERGGALNVQMALLWGAMLALVLAVVQVALVFYAGQLALTAAEDGVRSGRTGAAPASPSGAAGAVEEARRDAEAFLARTAGSTLTATSVTATLDPGAGTVSVTVTGRVLAVLPGVSLPITRQAVGGLEQVTP
jgi:Flp pilus assembly protein TadG